MFPWNEDIVNCTYPNNSFQVRIEVYSNVLLHPRLRLRWKIHFAYSLWLKVYLNYFYWNLIIKSSTLDQQNALLKKPLPKMLSMITGMPIWPVSLGGFWLKLYFLSCDVNESMKNVFKTLISSSFSGVKLLK